MQPNIFSVEVLKIPYPLLALISVSLFALIHLWAEKTRSFNSSFFSKFLSTGSGVAIAYVFIDLLPKLGQSDQQIKDILKIIFPYIEHHVFVMALIGFLLFFLVDRSQKLLFNQSFFFLLSLMSYSLFNFLIGYAVVDPWNPEVKPLFLFTIAMGLHFFMNDYALTEAHGDKYRYFGKWILIASLFLGWLVGYFIELPAPAIAMVSAFIGGGVIMNVMRHELPTENPNNTGMFVFATFVYTCILLSIGNR